MGSGTLVAAGTDEEDRTFRVRSGQGFLIAPNQITTYTADERNPWEYAWVEFDGLWAKEAVMLAGLTRNDPLYKSSDLTLSRELKEIMYKLAGTRGETTFCQIGLLYQIIDLLIRSSVSQQVGSSEHLSDLYIKEAFSFIEKNFQNDISVEEIAETCNLSRGYLNKVFKKYTGKSPQAFLINYRMSKAVQLLRQSDLPVGDIGEAVGYPNRLHFSRAFKNTYGLSPRDWRKANCK